MGDISEETRRFRAVHLGEEPLLAYDGSGVFAVTVSPGGKTARFRCPHCRRWHEHGWAPEQTGPTHRAAHCFKEGSPFQEHGYWLIAAS